MRNLSSENFIIKLIRDLFAQGGAKAYGRTGVTMVEHMLQTAALAEQADGPDHLVVAALLHDIGHFGTDFPLDYVSGQHTEMSQQHIDRHHEEAGADALRPYFGPEITQPIRLHVAAKRYLCAVEAEYSTRLSATTSHTLGLQGGPMTAAEVEAFEHQPYAQEAVSLRRWDDQATTRGIKTPNIDHYRPLLERLLRG